MIDKYCGNCKLVKKTFDQFLEENQPCVDCYESQDETIESQYLEIKRLEDIVKEAAENLNILLSNWDRKNDVTERDTRPVGVKCCRAWLFKHEKEFLFPYKDEK